MGYLKCEKCGGYYELQDGESPADFEDICECGGQLNYVQNLDDFSNIIPDSNENNLNNHETLDDYLNHTSSNENTASKNNKVSSDKLTSQKANPHSTKNKNPKVNNIKPILNWWQKQNQNKKIGIIILFLIIIIAIGAVFASALSPKVTMLKITSPTTLTNEKVDYYAYKEYTITNTTDKIGIKGLTEPNANVTAYVIYDTDPRSSQKAKETGKAIPIEVDKKTGEFVVNVDTNPNHQGDTLVYIVATSSGKEENAAELILTIPKPAVSDTTPTTTNSNTTTSSNPGEDYDRGYDTGYQDGVTNAYDKEPFNDGISSTLKVSEWWIAGYKEGYKKGYETIKSGGSLQKPQLSWNAYYDPRNGKTIE